MRNRQNINPVKAARIFFLLAVFIAVNSWASSAQAEEAFPNRIKGDLGILINSDQSPIRGDSTHPVLLPLAYFDYGRMFTRLDIFGIKTLPVGYGYLEIVGRVKFDAYKTAGNAALKGIDDRQNSFPIGVGTFQLTPIGGFFLYALHDVNRSQGNLLDATYAAEFEFWGMTAYPEAGVEYYTSKYTQYYYGISNSEAAKSGSATYSPAAAVNPYLNILLQVPLMDGWNANFYLRRKWLGTTIANSPLVDRTHIDAGFVAVVRHFD